jgi:hypothetical protein
MHSSDRPDSTSTQAAGSGTEDTGPLAVAVVENASVTAPLLLGVRKRVFAFTSE